MYNNRPVHQRFTAEHIQFQIMALLAAFNSKLNSLFRSFLAHELTAATERTGVGKAITAAQIAVMSYKQAQGFDNRLFGKSRRYIKGRAEKQTFILQAVHFFQCIAQILFAVFILQSSHSLSIVAAIIIIE